MTGGYRLPESRVYLKEGDALYSASPIRGPGDAVDVLGRNLLSLMDREAVVVVSLDVRKRPINYHVVSIGGLDSAYISIQNCFKVAILANADSILVLHNHPSGDISPSHEDMAVTEKLKNAGEIMGIGLLDHIIVGAGRSDYYSMMAHGLLQPDRMAESVAETKAQYMGGKEKLDELTKQLEAGVKDIFDSGKYQEYLDVMARFYRYSAGNCALIAMQRPDATAVASYGTWRDRFQRHVLRGEQGIKIIQPAPYKSAVEVEKHDEHGNPVYGNDGKPEREIQEVTRMAYKVGYVYDVSQTDGAPLPELVHTLDGKMDRYTMVMEALKSASPAKIEFGDTGMANGFYDREKNRIVVKEGLPQQQTVKTTLHEIAHAYLHSKGSDDSLQNRVTREVQAESVAYVCSRQLGVDSGAYSFGYIAGWSKGKDLQELKASMEKIQKTALQIIGKVEQKLMLMEKEKLSESESMRRDLSLKM